MDEYTIENSDIAVYETARDEQEAFDTATVLAEDYPGRKFYIHYYGQPIAAVWWENGQMHTKRYDRAVQAAIRYSGILYRTV